MIVSAMSAMMVLAIHADESCCKRERSSAEGLDQACIRPDQIYFTARLHNDDADRRNRMRHCAYFTAMHLQVQHIRQAHMLHFIQSRKHALNGPPSKVPSSIGRLAAITFAASATMDITRWTGSLR
jgi:hypothetical protein